MWRQLLVHPCGDRADLRCGRVGDDIPGTGAEHESDHVAGADSPTRHPDRSLVGEPVEIRVRKNVTVLGYERWRVAEAASRLAHDVGEHLSALRFRSACRIGA